ncbi:MAG: hypothetical protein LBK52_03540 [Deltaproteobacteria bacterium]|nr:hypothetical protein [Deltaproteobacteria bacterium]
MPVCSAARFLESDLPEAGGRHREVRAVGRPAWPADRGRSGIRPGIIFRPAVRASAVGCPKAIPPAAGGWYREGRQPAGDGRLHPSGGGGGGNPGGML